MVSRSGRELHAQIERAKADILSAEKLLERISKLDTVEVSYDVGYNYSMDSTEVIRVNAPASCVREHIKGDIIKLQIRKEELVEAYKVWIEDGK